MPLNPRKSPADAFALLKAFAIGFVLGVATMASPALAVVLAIAFALLLWAEARL